MGHSLALNAPDGERAFLRGLQASFPGWGGREEFRWWFERAVNGPPADLLLLLHPEHGAVAGAAVCHRVARGLPGGGTEPVAIMSGAWTDPRHRRQGCFRTLIGHAQQVAALRGAGALLAFAGADRPSTPALAAAAAGCADGWYVRTPAGGAAPAAAAAGGGHRARPSAADLYRWFTAQPGAGMVYRDAARFAVQARLRRANTAVVAAGPGHWAIVEPRGGAGRVHAVVSEDGALTDAGWSGAFRALAACPPTAVALLGYTTRPAVAGDLGLRLDATAGHLFVLRAGDADPARLIAAQWWLHGLDRA